MKPSLVINLLLSICLTQVALGSGCRAYQTNQTKTSTDNYRKTSDRISRIRHNLKIGKDVSLDDTIFLKMALCGSELDNVGLSALALSECLKKHKISRKEYEVSIRDNMATQRNDEAEIIFIAFARSKGLDFRPVDATVVKTLRALEHSNRGAKSFTKSEESFLINCLSSQKAVDQLFGLRYLMYRCEISDSSVKWSLNKLAHFKPSARQDMKEVWQMSTSILQERIAKREHK